MSAGTKGIKLPFWRNFRMLFVFVMIAVLLVIGYLYGLDANNSERTVYVALRGYLSTEQKTALEQQFSGYAPESWEDGINLRFFEFPAGDANARETSALYTELVTQIHTGDADLILMDLYVYNLIGDETLFTDLSVLYPDHPALVQRNLYAVKGTVFCKLDDLSSLPELYLTLRDERLAPVREDAESTMRHDFFKELLGNIASGENPKGYTEIGPLDAEDVKSLKIE